MTLWTLGTVIASATRQPKVIETLCDTKDPQAGADNDNHPLGSSNSNSHHKRGAVNVKQIAEAWRRRW